MDAPSERPAPPVRLRRPFGFSRGVRLRRGADVQNAQRRGRRRSDRFLTVCVWPSGRDASRLGLAVSRKVGGAVVRNRVKRRVRDAFRRLRPAWDASGPAVDLVVIARPEAAHLGGSELAAMFARLVEGARGGRR